MGSLSVIENTEAIPSGHDHASLALMPFVATQDAEERRKAVTFTYQTVVDEKIRRVQYTLIPAEGGELPTQHDQPVLLGLIQLWLRAPEPDRAMTYNRREILDLLQWSHCGKNYDRLNGALERLTALTIKIESALVSRNGRPYGGGQGAAHIIDRYWLDRGRNATGTIEWGGLVMEALHLGDFKRLDWGLMLSLGDPIAAHLYRIVDRATMSGQTEWTVGWRTLCSLLGMTPGGYARPAKFKQRIEPRLDKLVEGHVIEGWRYERGGKFTFLVRNYLRSQLRRVLGDLGVYDEASRQLVAGHDEVVIMCQCDQLHHGAHPRPEKPGGWLTNAIREAYDLRYPPDEPETFCGIWSMLSEDERSCYHKAGLKLCGVGEDLFATRPDPTAWPQELRSVVRFMVSHSLEPGQV